ncbi:MAG: hypothetical protein AAFY08_09670 [Planctomycetota bacterium]
MRARRARRVVGWVGGCVVLALVGCASPPPQDPPPPAEVTLTDIAPPEPVQPPEQANAAGDSGLLYRIQRVDVSLDRPMNAAWAIIDESVASPILRTAWENNGLRLGKLPAAEATDLAKAIGPPAAIRDNTLLNIAEPAPVRTSARIARPIPVDLTLPPMNIRQEWADRGRFRLLLREVEALPGGVELELMLQRFDPQARLIPRNADEIGDVLLDGQVYEPLTTRVLLAPSEMLVIGLHWPWLPPREPIPSFLDPPANPAEDAEDTPPDAPAPLDEPGNTTPPAPDASPATPDNPLNPAPVLEAPPLKPSIGRELLVGERLGRPVQLLLVITVDDGSVLVQPPPTP